VTTGEWLATRAPAPPDALRQRLLEQLGPHGSRPSADAHEVLIDAATSLLTQLLREGRTTRDAALDLLVVDSLVTYAFEAAADAPDDLERRAERATTRIAALGLAEARPEAR
jgi:hypothetical protein